METVKKIIKIALTTGTTYNSSGQSIIIIIPNTGVTYNMSISLTDAVHEWGFFDAYDFTGVTGITLSSLIPYTVTGFSSSRLIELKKYIITNNILDQYFQSTSPLIDGVNPVQSQVSTMPYKFVYYLGGISYVEIVTESGSTTTFEFNGEGHQSANFINKPIYKDPNKENIIQNPKIDSDVFIDREEMSAFDKNYKLEYIENLVDLETYAAGSYFNIINNT